MNTDAVNTILILSNFNLNCEVATRGQRLLDVLNDGNTRYLQIRSGQMSGGSGQQAVLEIGETLVVKDNLEMALPFKQVLRGPATSFMRRLSVTQPRSS